LYITFNQGGEVIKCNLQNKSDNSSVGKSKPSLGAKPSLGGKGNSGVKITTAQPAKSSVLSICYWNINGLSEDKLDRDAAGSFVTKYDIIIFAETWRSDPPTLSGYKCIDFPRIELNVNARRGSGGISVFIKDDISPFVKVVKHYHDCIVWLNIEDHTIDAVPLSNKHVMLGAVYFPPEGSTYNCNKEDYYDMLENDILQFNSCAPTVICGDFNARTESINDNCISALGSDAPDSIHQNLYECIPKGLCKERRSEDKGRINKYGKKLIELCKATGVRILNGRSLGDQNGNFTRIGTTGSSVIDYALCDSKGFDIIENFVVHNIMPESDHCPILLSIKGTFNTKNCNFSGLSCLSVPVQKGPSKYNGRTT
jgi:hypothetical protein